MVTDTPRNPGERAAHVDAQCPACALHELVPVALARQSNGVWGQVDPEQHESDQLVLLDACPICNGAWFDLGELGDLDGDGGATETSIREVRVTPTLGTRPCPRGHGAMFEQHLPGRLETPIDRCSTCGGIWLDGDERRKLARASTREGQESPRATWLKRGAIYAAQLLTHLPVEVENPGRGTPWAVFALVLMLVVAFVVQLGDRIDPYLYGIVPGRMVREWDIGTLVTHQLFHSGWVHLLGNIYFLYVFGDNVEHLFGRRRFVAFFVVAGILGGLAHALMSRATATLVIGASGAIAGILGAYLWSFPRAKLFQVVFFIPLKLPVWAYLLVWLAFHLIMAFLSADTSVAWFEHLGGFAFGLAVTPVVLYLRRREVARSVAVPARAEWAPSPSRTAP